jgi:hypothetical protein
MAKGWTITSARAMNLSASPHEHRIRGVGRGRGESGRTTTNRLGRATRSRDRRADGDGWPAVASAMLVPKLIADAGDNASLRFLDDHHFLMTNENHRDVSRI